MFSQSFGLMTDDTGSLSWAIEGYINVKSMWTFAYFSRCTSTWGEDLHPAAKITQLLVQTSERLHAARGSCLCRCLLDIIKCWRCLATPVTLNPTSWKTMASDSRMETCIRFSRWCELANASQLLNSSYFSHLIINCLHISTFAHLPENKMLQGW